MDFILIAAAGALIASLVPLVTTALKAVRNRSKRQGRVKVAVEGWNGIEVTLTIKPDSEESISDFLDDLKRARFGDKVISPESPKEESRVATAEVA